ncbi:hypothetical protein [Pseudomonas abietaniphila]|uniref:Haemolysin XhlA n=1 Tax=Pseudomonas abietaniphila TaxID=89065 RepID=A0A1G8LLE5_9PSED|nr:hypothetical protein [Pseudomonas abietaniphila]SDI56531.1 hypothetical protein SAMN05216605_114182 [Pseudomonas abietaniphila]
MGEIIRKALWGRGVDGNSGGGDDTGGGNPPGGSELERRVEKLEATMAEIQVRLIRVELKLDSTATKADLSDLATSFHKSMTEQTWKFITAAIGMSGLFAAISFGVAHLMK